MRKIFLPLIFIAPIIFGGWAVARATDQIKTMDTFVGDSDTAVSSQVNRTFSIYIGDNISGVTNPVKSVYSAVSGVYTGSGTLQLQLDSDSATLRTFTLPNVSTTPTPFSILYKDPSGKISPTSSGSYTYTLNIIPSGITIYGLGAKVKTTYRFVPPSSCPDGQPSAEKIKSTDTFVGDSDTSVTGTVNRTFSIYIGDNISGVSAPIKSIYFPVSGVYTGSGTLGLQLDSDTATLRTFTLPNVGTTPTPFSILYKDPSGKISPTSSGSYTYTLNIIPSGITIYGLGAKVKTTYRYKPPSCGTGLPISGDLTSAVFETTSSSDGPAYNSVMWKGTVEGTGKIKFQIATSDCSNGKTNPPSCNDAGVWTFRGGATCGTGDFYDTKTSGTGGGPDKPVEISCAAANHNNNRYYKYKIRICSNTDCATSGVTSPIVNDVIVNWAP